MKKSLGDYLLEEGIISSAQLEVALEVQTLYGGRLGFNLVDLGYLKPVELTQHLAKYHGVPPAMPREVSSVAAEVWKDFPRELALKHKVFPLAIDRTRVTVAMADPQNLAVMDEISFITGRMVVARVAAEFTIKRALEMCYDAEPFSEFFRKAHRPEIRRIKARVGATDGMEDLGADDDRDDFESLSSHAPLGDDGELDDEPLLRPDGVLTEDVELGELNELDEESERGQADDDDLASASIEAAPGVTVGGTGWDEGGDLGADPSLLPDADIYTDVQVDAVEEDDDTPAEGDTAEAPIEADAEEGADAEGDRTEGETDEVGADADDAEGGSAEADTDGRDGQVEEPAADAGPAEVPGDGDDSPGDDDNDDDDLVEAVVAEAAPGGSEVATDIVALQEETQYRRVSRRFGEAMTRDQIGEALLDYSIGFLERAAVFSLRKGEVRGWLALGDGIDRERFEATQLPVDGGLLRECLESRAHVIGAPEEGTVDAQLVAALGEAHPSTVLLHPIIVRKKPIGILYGDNGDGREADGPKLKGRFDEFVKVLNKAQAAFEMILIKWWLIQS